MSARLVRPLAARALLAAAMLVATAIGSTVMLVSRADAEPDAPSAAQLLKDADRARGGEGLPIAYELKVHSKYANGNTLDRTYAVVARSEKALVAVTAPADKVGEKVLITGKDVWQLAKGSTRPTSVPASERLSGLTSIGDIAATSFSRDYEGKLVRTEGKGDDETYVLELKPTSNMATYDGVRYFIARKSGLGVKAEFLSPDGAVLRVAVFSYDQTFERVGGGTGPFISAIKLEDKEGGKATAEVTYGAPKKTTIAPDFFDVKKLAAAGEGK